MEVKRRTQQERTAATRAALVAAARPLFAARGFAAVSTPELAAAAQVTRGALYHQFTDKRGLFLAVVYAVEADVTRRIVAQVGASGAADPGAALHAAADAWLDACEEPEVRQVLLLDAPVVLGWEGFRDVALEHGLGLTEWLLRGAVDAGLLAEQPLRPLAHVLIGALDEAALYVATHEDPETARAETSAVLHRLLDGLLSAS
jgi:AcrR family transcriptional regulator